MYSVRAPAFRLLTVTVQPNRGELFRDDFPHTGRPSSRVTKRERGTIDRDSSPDLGEWPEPVNGRTPGLRSRYGTVLS